MQPVDIQARRSVPKPARQGGEREIPDITALQEAILALP